MEWAKKRGIEYHPVLDEYLLDLNVTPVISLGYTTPYLEMMREVIRELETQFPKVAEACYGNLLKHLDPLLKQAQQNVGRLNTEIYRTNELCAEIQRKYNFRWDKPFLILILTTALSGTFVALFLFLMQTSPLALFLMDAKAREAYDYGMSHIVAKEQWDALPQAEKDTFLGKVSSPAPAAKHKKGSKKKPSR